MSPAEPSVRELLTFHYECLQGMYFSEYQELSSGALLFSDSIKDPYYNFFAPVSLQGGAVPEAVRNEFARRDRQPAVYLTPLAGSGDPHLSREPWGRDAWLVGATDRLTEVSFPDQLDVAVVGGEEREDYVATFTAAYSGDDPDDPYGQLDPAYSACLHRSFDRDVAGYHKYYVLARLGGKPVGVAAMFTAGSLAGVYGVGTAPEHRRAGVGSAMMTRMTQIAVTDGATHILLQTEAGSAVQRWYEKLGYRLVFTAEYIQVGGEAES